MNNFKLTKRAAHETPAAFIFIFFISFLLSTRLPDTYRWILDLLLASMVAWSVIQRITAKSRKRFVQELTASLREVTAGGQDSLQEIATPYADLVLLNRSLEELVQYLSVVKRDIDLRKTELASIVDGLIDGLIVVDQDLTVRLINKAALNLLGIRDSESQGKYLWEVVRNYNLVQSFDDAIRNEHPVEAEIRLYSPKKVLRTHTNPIRNKGQLTGAVAVLHDITEIRRLEQVRTDFVANVSHELRTPITSIKGFVETLLDGAMENVEDTKRFLRIIERDTNRMVNIVNDLLELSRIESTGRDLPKNPIDIIPIVTRSTQALQEKAEQKNIALKTEVADKPLIISGDPGMIGQVVFNLVDNAIKYTNPGGKVQVVANALGDTINLVVEDTGIGIAEKHLERIFERFYRVDKGRSREMGGTGLGLSIVKHVVEIHSGTITVESKPGEGTRFIISFPALDRELRKE